MFSYISIYTFTPTSFEELQTLFDALGLEYSEEELEMLRELEGLDDNYEDDEDEDEEYEDDETLKMREFGAIIEDLQKNGVSVTKSQVKEVAKVLNIDISSSAIDSIVKESSNGNNGNNGKKASSSGNSIRKKCPTGVKYTNSDILTATMNGESTTVQCILEVKNEKSQKVNIDVQDEEGYSPLIWAAFKGHGDILKMLLFHGADINKKDGHDGLTALMFATVKGHEKELKILLEYSHDLDIDAQDKDGNTALVWAIRVKNAKIVKLLIGHCAKVDLANKDEEDPLRLAKTSEATKEVKEAMKAYSACNIMMNPDDMDEEEEEEDAEL